MQVTIWNPLQHLPLGSLRDGDAILRWSQSKGFYHPKGREATVEPLPECYIHRFFIEELVDATPFMWHDDDDTALSFEACRFVNDEVVSLGRDRMAICQSDVPMTLSGLMQSFAQKMRRAHGTPATNWVEDPRTRSGWRPQGQVYKLPGLYITAYIHGKLRRPRAYQRRRVEQLVAA